MTRKIHIRANANAENPIAICASRFVGNGKVNFNSRRTYSYMASEIVGMREAAKLPADQLCAHCVEQALARRNHARKNHGKAPVTDWRIYED